MTKCSDHPDAPHGFNRSASHAEGRYVCDCEVCIPDDEEITMVDDVDVIKEAAERITQQAETIEQLMRQRDSYRHEANALNIENEQQAKTIASLQFHNKGLQAETNALKSEVIELKSELNRRINTIIELEVGLKSVNEYKDKLTPAVRVLVDQLKSGKVTLGAIYDVDFLLGE